MIKLTDRRIRQTASKTEKVNIRDRKTERDNKVNSERKRKREINRL